MAEKRLTKEIAEQFLADEESVDLSEFTEIKDDAAEVLISDITVLVQTRIRVLVETLNQYAEEPPFIWSTGVGFADEEQGDAECVALFSLLPKISCFPVAPRAWELEYEMRSFSAGVSESFSQGHDDWYEAPCDVEGNTVNHGELYLFIPSATLRAFPDKELHELRASVGLALTAFCEDGDIGKGLLVPGRLLESMATSLAFEGELDLSGITRMSEETATLLAGFKGEIVLNLDDIPESAAKIFREAPSSPVRAKGGISKQIAEQFLADEGSVDLSEFTEIADNASELLRWYYYELDLSGLTSLSDAAAESLSKHEGELSLNGLTSLSDAATESLSKHKGGYLALDGLTDLSDATAESLGRYKGGSLSLLGLTSLSDAAAESLSKKEGPDDEPVLTLVLDNLPPSAAEILRQHPSFQDDDD